MPVICPEAYLRLQKKVFFKAAKASREH